MKTHAPTRGEIREAAHAVVELAVLSLRPEYLCWSKTINLSLTEFAWNTACGDPLASWVSDEDPRLVELHERLVQTRRTKWPDTTCLIVGLDVRRSGDEALFTFDLTWDDGETMHPCEIAWDPAGVAPSSQN